MPIVAHNRYWAKDTDYAKWFDFWVGEKYSLPVV